MSSRLSFFALLLLGVTVATSANCLPRSQLHSAVKQIISQPQFAHQTWAMLVERYNATTSSYETILEMNAQQFMQPASNNKVLTTSAALTELGSDFRWSTPFIADFSGAENFTKNVIPSLCVPGQGDPSMTSAQLLAATKQIASQGFNTIKELIIDDSIFPNPPDSWEYGDFAYYYGAKPSSFVLDEGFVDILINPGPSVGSPVSVTISTGLTPECVPISIEATTVAADQPSNVTASIEFGVNHFVVKGQLALGHAVHHNRRALIDPNSYFQCALAQMLSKQQIVVEKISRRQCGSAASASQKTLAVIQSAPITTTMNWTLMTSDNLYTECYLRTLGAREKQRNPTASGDAQSLGLARVRTILSSLGVDTDLFQQIDGSGLSRYNLVTPAAMVATLRAMDKTKNSAIYKSFLPVAGVSGSLKHRFIGTPAVGIVHAKTGTLSGVVTLSGWIDKRPGYVFSVMSNQSRQPASVVQTQGVDQVVLQIVNLCDF